MAEASAPPVLGDAPAAATSSLPFKSILQQMVLQGASDLHLKVGRSPTLRVHGHLAALPMPPLKPEDLTGLAKELMSPRQIKEFAEHREADFATGVPGIGRFRVNVYQQRGTIAFAFYLDKAFHQRAKSFRLTDSEPPLRYAGRLRRSERCRLHARALTVAPADAAVSAVWQGPLA